MGLPVRLSVCPRPDPPPGLLVTPRPSPPRGPLSRPVWCSSCSCHAWPPGEGTAPVTDRPAHRRAPSACVEQLSTKGLVTQLPLRSLRHADVAGDKLCENVHTCAPFRLVTIPLQIHKEKLTLQGKVVRNICISKNITIPLLH